MRKATVVLSFLLIVLTGCSLILKNDIDLDGKGTKDEPYLISSAEDFILLNTAKSFKYYKLTNDISFENIGFEDNCSFEYSRESDNEFKGTCYVIKNFKGNIDGQDYKISDITLDKAHILSGDLVKSKTAPKIGIFGIISEGSEIKNIDFSNISIRTSTSGASNSGDIDNIETYVGLLAGLVESSTDDITVLENLTLNGSLTYFGNESRIGGLIGQVNGNAVIDNVKVKVEIKTDGDSLYVGGMFGSSTGANISKSVSVAEIKNTGNSTIGGFIGYSQSIITESSSEASIDSEGQIVAGGFVGEVFSYNILTPAHINNAFAVGHINNISDKSIIGGFAGNIRDYGYIFNTYNLMTINHKAPRPAHINGISGNQKNDKSVRNSFYVKTISGSNQATPEGDIDDYAMSIEMNDIRLGNIPTLSEAIWQKTTNDFPTLKAINEYYPEGFALKPITVDSIETFKRMTLMNWAYYSQTQDIDFEGSTVSNLFDIHLPFSGNYNGNGNRLKNITISNVDSNPIEEAFKNSYALFTKLSSAIFKNVRIDNISMHNISYLGQSNLSAALCTSMENSVIDNIEITGQITAQTNGGAISIGGLSGTLLKNNSIQNVAVNLDMKAIDISTKNQNTGAITTGAITSSVIGFNNQVNMVVFHGSLEVESIRTDANPDMNLIIGRGGNHASVSNLYFISTNYSENTTSPLYDSIAEITPEDLSRITNNKFQFDEKITIDMNQ